MVGYFRRVLVMQAGRLAPQDGTECFLTFLKLVATLLTPLRGETPRHPIEHLNRTHYAAVKVAQREEHFGLVIWPNASQNAQSHPNHVHRWTEPRFLAQRCLTSHGVLARH
jgi:hypothetical protein